MEQEVTPVFSKLELIDQRINFEKQILGIQIEMMFDNAWIDVKEQFTLFETKFRCAKRIPLQYANDMGSAAYLVRCLTLIQGVGIVEYFQDFGQGDMIMIRHQHYNSEVLYQELVNDIHQICDRVSPIAIRHRIMERITPSDNLLYIFLSSSRQRT